MRAELVVRCEEVLKETICRVRVGDDEGERFWTARGVRQGCPLNPSLFTLLLADMDDELEKGRLRGVKLGGGERVYTLAYADDVAVLAEDEEGMKGMLGKLERYVDGKGLQVNLGKAKVMRFRRGGGGRWKSVKWRWKGKELEEVRCFRYLGYTVMGNRGQVGHVVERMRKGAAIMGKVWGIGKRLFEKDWERRMWLFDRLVWLVVGYGPEVWGWEERENVERLQERFLKWVLGVDRCTPGYLVREGAQREMLKGRAGLRTWAYERKLEEGQGELARKCWDEVKGRIRKGGKKKGRSFSRRRGGRWKR